MPYNTTLETENQRDPLLNLLFLLLSCLFISSVQGGLWMLVPFLNGTIAFGISIVIFFLSLIDRKIMRFFATQQFGGGILLFLLLSFIYMLTEEESFTSSQFFTISQCFVIMLIAAHYSVDAKERRPFLIFYFFDLLVKLAANMYYAYLHPEMIRDSQLETFSINGTGFEKMVNIPVLYVLATICYIIFSNFKITKHKILLLLFVAAVFWLLIQAEMNLVMLTTFIVCLLVLFIHPKYYKQTLIIAALFGFILLIFSKGILGFIIEHEWFGDTTRNRLEDLYTIFFKGNSVWDNIRYYYTHAYRYENSSTIIRLYSYINSIKAFFHNFFLGTWTPNAIAHGGHSIWLDLVARYGFLILIYYRSLLKYQFHLLKDTDIQNRKAVISFIAAFIFLGIFNNFPLHYFTIQLYILLPYFKELIVKKEVKRQDADVFPHNMREWAQTQMSIDPCGSEKGE